MNAQLLIVILLFVLALAYLVRMISRNLKPGKNCGSNCKCSFSVPEKKGA